MKIRSLKALLVFALLLLISAIAPLNAQAAGESSDSGGFPFALILIPIIIVVIVIVVAVVKKLIFISVITDQPPVQPPSAGYGGQNGAPAPGGSTPSPYGSSDPYYGDPSRQNIPQNVGQGNYPGYAPGVVSSQSNNQRRNDPQQNNGNDPIALKCPNCGAPLGESDDVTTCPYCRSVLTNANLRAGRRNSGPIDFSAQDSVFNGFGDDAIHTGYGEESYQNTYGSGYGLGFDDNDL